MVQLFHFTGEGSRKAGDGRGFPACESEEEPGVGTRPLASHPVLVCDNNAHGRACTANDKGDSQIQGVLFLLTFSFFKLNVR